MFETLGRRTILSLAKSPGVGRLVRRFGPAFGATRFVAGETVAAAMQAVASANRDGILATLDHLGESVADRRAAEQAADSYLEILDAIAQTGVKSNASLKLTMMGLDIDRDLAVTNLRRVLDRARTHGNFVRIDMESSAYTDVTLDIYREVRAAGYDNVGVVIQAYLYRSEADLAALDQLAPNVRVVKGAYQEPAAVAYPVKADTDRSYRRLVQRQIGHGFYTAVATHDPALIQSTLGLHADGDRYEFQMLYGIRSGLQRELAQAGHRVRVYIPFGTEWYPYLMRRLAERPANLGFVVRNLMQR
ncbi:MAG TPA: proline dehydrogenase family protein [Bacillota bacterium]|nr:proline dehydrogenase family protein [Bacillota bacterium]